MVMIHQRYRQTDDMQSQDRALHYTTSRVIIAQSWTLDGRTVGRMGHAGLQMAAA